MTFLPIVERELRVAARRPSSFWLRVAAASAAILIGGGFLFLQFLTAALGGSGMPFKLGTALFSMLTWLSLGAALIAGLFFTSDCLSEEKREGTLGLLFLTDLRGYDVVLGKLIATSLRVFYGLLAIFPILAVALLLGGVTGGEFWRRILSLVNALFFSLAVGMLVSAISRDTQRALAGTILLMVAFIALPLIADAWISRRAPGYTPRLSHLSPGFNFVVASDFKTGPFWISLAATQLVAWGALALAALSVPRAWQQKAAGGTTSSGPWMQRWKFGSAKNRAARRQRLLSSNPVLWLVCRERWQGVAMRAALVGIIGLLIWFLWSESSNPMVLYLATGLVGIVGLLVNLWMASQASRFCVEARRSGSMELLLASPLTVKEIIAGQWLAVRRLFALPVLLLMALHLVVSVLRTETMFTPSPAGAGPIFSLAGKLGFAACSMLTLVADLVALGWFGMWMGLTSRNANFATLKTFVFVQIIPWFAMSFVAPVVILALMASRGFSLIGNSPTTAFQWIPLVSVAVSSLLSWGKDAAFALWARRRLYSSFREMAAQPVAPVRLDAPPVVPRSLKPPMIRPAS